MPAKKPPHSLVHQIIYGAFKDPFKWYCYDYKSYNMDIWAAPVPYITQESRQCIKLQANHSSQDQAEIVSELWKKLRNWIPVVEQNLWYQILWDTLAHISSWSFFHPRLKRTNWYVLLNLFLSFAGYWLKDRINSILGDWYGFLFLFQAP